MEGSMYPVNQEISMFGKTVVWPGVDAQGKFTNGDFNDPLVPPSFIPAESINLILDNLTEVIKRSGIKPDNTSGTQLAQALDKRLIALLEYTGYIQWPGMKSPLEIPALHFEGYSWHEVNYRGNFFRAKGDNAKPFSSKRLTKEQIKNGEYLFQDDEQGDAIRNIEGEVKPNGSDAYLTATGAFGLQKAHGTHAKWSWSGLPIEITKICLNLKKIVPTAEENRSRNLTFTIWVLVKD